MRTLSGTDLAIALGWKTGKLRFVERKSRLGGTYVALEDDHGVIEVHDTLADAKRRVDSVVVKVEERL
jgi:hypothetical protein